MEAYSRTGLMTALYAAMSISFCLANPDAVSTFINCSGLCACTDILLMFVLYVRFGSKVRPITFGCVAMRSAVLFILRSRMLLYSAESGVKRVQIVLSGFSVRFFVLSRQKLYAGMVVCICWLNSCLCV